MSELFIVATPIGNLEDISARALRILTEVDFIFAEDTRVTKKLCSRHSISTQIKSFHHHSREADLKKIKEILEQGDSIAYVTDAGTPGVSDPGGKLVQYVTNELPGIKITPIPGPSALTAALSIAGIPLDEFLFLGFLPHKKGRKTKLERVASSEIPVVLFESVHRIQKLIKELGQFNKQVIVCRELTKQFETIYRGSTQTITVPKAEEKGEFVLIIY